MRNAGFWFVGCQGLIGGHSRGDRADNTSLSASYSRAAHPWTTTPGRACGRGRVPAAAGSVGHSSLVTEVEGACLFGSRRRAAIGGARRGGGAGVWVSQWLEVRRKRGTGRGRAHSRVAWGSPSPGTQVWGGGNARSPGAGTAACGDGGAMEQRERGGGVPRLPGELGAKWSLLGMRPPWFPSPMLPSPSCGGQSPLGRWVGG